jgi:hypothetical protein
MVNETILLGVFGAVSGLVYGLTNQKSFYTNGKFDFVKLNYVLAGIHAAAAVAVYLLLRGVSDPDYLPLTPNRSKIVEGAVDTFDNVLENVGSPISVPNAIVMFYAVTAFTHLVYANFWRTGYLKAIDEKHNPVRWIEYSISATIMIYIVCLTVGVRDVTALIPIIGANIGTMYTGYMAEEAIRKYDFEAALRSIVLGWGLQIAIFGSIFMKFIHTLGDVNAIVDGVTGERKYKIPGFVYFVLIPTFLYYTSFGVVAILWYMNAKNSYEKTGSLPSFEGTEKWYLYLSLFSKLFLGLYISYGLTQQSDISAITP